MPHKIRLTHILLAAVLLAVMTACSLTGAPATGGADVPRLELDPTGSYAEGFLIIGYHEGQDPAAAASSIGAIVSTDWAPLRAALLELPTGMSVAKARSLLASSGLRYTEPRLAIEQAPVPATGLDRQQVEDPEYGLQWMHRQMNTEAAWAAGVTGAGIRIGIHDSFMDHRHPDLVDNVFYPGLDGFSNTEIVATTPHDGGSDHGTAVAGTAAATSNDLGGRGIAPGASLVPLSISDPGSGALDLVAILRAGLFAALGPDGCSTISCPSDSDNAPGGLGYVHIVNMSWGSNGYSQVVKDLMDFMLLHDIVLVTSAGNTPTQSFASPAWYPGLITVAATTPSDQRTSFSNRGLHLDVAAPGEAVWTTTTRACIFATPDGSSCAPEDVDYTFINGTSFSSPAVAGAAALVMEAMAERDGTGAYVSMPTPAQVRSILTSTAFQPDGSDYNEDLGHGIADAGAAVALAQASTVAGYPDGAGLVVNVVLAGDPSTGLPKVGVSLIPLDGHGPTKSVQTADGSFWAEGQALFLGIDPGDYVLAVSGPHEASTGADSDVHSQLVTLLPGALRAVTVALDVQAFDDPSEPNESIADAKPVTMGSTVRGAFYHPTATGDEDFFSIDVTSGTTYWLNIDTASGNADAVMEVLAADGTVLASNDDYGETPSGSALPDPALQFAATTTETVYIRLFADSNSRFNVYDLDVSVLAGVESEPNGSGTSNSGNITSPDFTNADPLQPGQAIEAEIGTSGEIDIFAVPFDPGTFIVDLETQVNLNPDTVLVVFDSSGDVVASNDDYDLQDSRAEFEILTAGTYYVAVSDYVTSTQGSTGPYTLSVTTRP